MYTQYAPADLNNTVPIAVPLNLMNTVLKRSRKYRIAQNCKITHTVQLTLVSLQTPFSLSELAYIVTAEILEVANNPNLNRNRGTPRDRILKLI